MRLDFRFVPDSPPRFPSPIPSVTALNQDLRRYFRIADHPGVGPSMAASALIGGLDTVTHAQRVSNFGQSGTF